MYHFLYLSIFVLLFSACNTNSTVNVKIDNIPAQKVLLQEIKGPDIVAIDSAEIEAGQPFSLKGAFAEEGMYRLLFTQGKYIMLALEKGDQAEVSGEWSNLTGYTVTGSAKSAIAKGMVSHAEKIIIDLRTYQVIFDSLKAKGDETKLQTAQKNFQRANEGLRTYLKSFADTTTSAIAAIMALNAIDPKLDAPFITKFYQTVEKRFPGNETIQIYKERFSGTNSISSAPANTTDGNPAPDFTGQTPNGKTISLQDYRGQYVLIDFWASWCAPCRAENPNVVKAYNQFKQKGFDILGVSLDNDKDNWEKAIAKDGLRWQHVSELRGWSSPTAKKYGVQSIPTNFLVDPNGLIVATNLRGEALLAKLNEVLK